MERQEGASLRNFNTFGIEARARYLSTFTSPEELAALLAFARAPSSAVPPSSAAPPSSAPTLSASARTAPPLPTLILGGGSNILLTKDFDGLVLLNGITGIDLVRETDHHVYIKAGAGENWHAFVEYCLKRNWAGVENLSLIPGSVGASPMQNIGAYGVEIKEVFHELEALDLATGAIRIFTVNDCRFGYRDSVFKQEYKGRFVILYVTYRLKKIPKFHIEYGAIREELDKMGVTDLTIRAISQAVINIRKAKLPDPAVIGNAGSFFKNPVVSAEQFAALRVENPGIVGFPNPDGTVKLAAGWLIEEAGWKGYRKGDAGCHAKQALVLVNYGNATGSEIYALSEEILQSVRRKFGVTLEREVNII